MKNASTPTTMSINYNPHNNSHFLLMQDYCRAVANWLKWRSYICCSLLYTPHMHTQTHTHAYTHYTHTHMHTHCVHWLLQSRSLRMHFKGFIDADYSTEVASPLWLLQHHTSLSFIKKNQQTADNMVESHRTVWNCDLHVITGSICSYSSTL